MRKIFTVVLGLILLTGCSPKGCPTMGGQSNVTYLQKIRDGVVFSEGFENDNFVSAEGWTVLQGVPANTSTQYLPGSNGIRSWDNSANAQSLPVAKKVITDKAVDAAWLVQCWFYDDSTQTTQPGPYFKIKDNLGNFSSIGVRNSISTTKYSYVGFGSSNDAPTTATSFTRVTGWHNFSFYGLGNGTVQLSFDGFNVATLTEAALSISEIYLCSDSIGGPGPSFGFFDNVGYFRDVNALVYFSGNITLNLYDKNNAFLLTISSSVSPITLSGFGPGIVVNTVMPFQGFIEIKNTGSDAILYRSNLLNINFGDALDFKQVLPGQKFNPYKPQLMALSDINQSTAGNTETIFNAYKNKYRFGVQMLEGMSFKDQIDNWFNYAVQGGPFSIQVDNTHVGFGVIDSNPAVGTNVIQIKPNLSTHPTDAFTVGRKYVLFNAANTRRQVVNLQAINDPCLAFVENIDYPFVNLDYIADVTFNPFLELGNNPYGLQTLDERYVRFRWDQTVQEWSNG